MALTASPAPELLGRQRAELRSNSPADSGESADRRFAAPQSFQLRCESPCAETPLPAGRHARAVRVVGDLTVVLFSGYGRLATDVLLKTLQLADKSNPAVPRKPDGSIDRAAAVDKATNDRKFQAEVVGPLYAQYSKSAGVQPADATYTIRGGASPAAYWMATPDGKVLLDKNKSGPEVAKILAVDEDPAYSTGFIIVELKDDVRRDWLAKLGMITRPTAIDALGFDQFKVHPDPTACVGVTSGGMPEVVVRGAQLGQTNIVRQP